MSKEDLKDPKAEVIDCIQSIRLLTDQIEDLNDKIFTLMKDNDSLKTESLGESLDLMYWCVYGASENIRQHNGLIFDK